MDPPTLSPAGVGSPSSPSVLQDLSSMTDMVTELSRPVDRAQLEQDIDDFNLTYPVNVDDALNAFTLLPVAGTGTAPATTTAPPPTITTAPITTTATQTLPTTSTRTRPTTTTTSRPRPVTSTRTRPVTTATTTTAPSRPLTARHSAGAGTRTTTSTVTTPTGRPTIAAKQPRRRPRVPSPPSPDSSPPSDDEDEDDDDDDRRRGLRRRLDLLNEDAQQRARGRRIRNITHTNKVTTVYEDGGGRPSVRRTSTRTSSPSPPRPPRTRPWPSTRTGSTPVNKGYKNSVFPPTVLVPCVAVVDTRWLLGANANAPRLDDNHHVDVESRVGRRRSWWISKKAFSC